MVNANDTGRAGDDGENHPAAAAMTGDGPDDDGTTPEPSGPSPDAADAADPDDDGWVDV